MRCGRRPGCARAGGRSRPGGPRSPARRGRHARHRHGAIVVVAGERDDAGSTAGDILRAIEHAGEHLLRPGLELERLRLPELLAANIASVKIEGRQRSPAYVSQVAKVWRQAIDRCMADPQNYAPQAAWMETLGAMSEGTQTTLGAYHRKWQ